MSEDMTAEERALKIRADQWMGFVRTGDFNNFEKAMVEGIRQAEQAVRKEMTLEHIEYRKNLDNRVEQAEQAMKERAAKVAKEILDSPPSEDSLTADSSEDDWYKGFLGGWNDALTEAEQAIRALEPKEQSNETIRQAEQAMKERAAKAICKACAIKGAPKFNSDLQRWEHSGPPLLMTCEAASIWEIKTEK